MVLLYDSVQMNKQIKYCPNDTKIKVIGTTQKQLGGKDCGIFAIIFATTLALGGDPGSQISSTKQDETSPSKLFFLVASDRKCLLYAIFIN